MKFLLLLLFTSLSLFADDKPIVAGEIKLTPEQELQAYSAQLKLTAPKEGQLKLAHGIQIDLPEGYVFYDAASANKILTGWGNPPSQLSGEEPLLGLIFSEKNGLISETALTITVEANLQGYISDDSAEDYDYDEILEAMQDGIKESNPSRIEQGYGSLELIGWATPPNYDAATKKLYFAKELKFNNSEINTLNYDIHVLGRRGYIKLTFLSEIGALAKVEQSRKTILDAVNYSDEFTYGKFTSGDKEAEGDLQSLITGSNVVIAGGILALLVKFKKFIIFGFIAFAGFFGKLFGRKEEA